MKHSVLLDTSFLVRLLNDEDKLHENALSYYKYFFTSGHSKTKNVLLNHCTSYS